MSDEEKTLKRITNNSFVKKELFMWSKAWDVLWTLQSATQTLNDLETTETYEIVLSRRHGDARIRPYRKEPVDYDRGEVSIVAENKDGNWIFSIGPWFGLKESGE